MRSSGDKREQQHTAVMAALRAGQPVLSREVCRREEEDGAFSRAVVWNTPIISAFGKLRQGDSILKVQVQQRLTSVWRGVSVAEALMISF